ncbi:MAG: aryl-sulfate sulfotransferase [Polyangiaceae bacterium]|nr:aryl-sulfate sulfotransferase [Polyangiaceae bacterium]
MHRLLVIVPLITGLVIAGSAIGCGRDDPAKDPPSTLTGVDISVVSPRNVRIRWQPLEGGQVVIRRAVPGEEFLEVGRKASTHGRFLDLALEPLGSYAYQLVMCRDDSCEAPFESEVVSTPESAFAAFDITVPSENPDDAVAIFGVYRVSPELFREGHMGAVDRAGNVLWEYVTDEWGPITEVQPLPDGTIATGQFMYLVQIDLDGTELFRWSETTARHDIQKLPDGRWAFLRFDPFEHDGFLFMGDGISVLNREGTAVEWQWMARDYIDLADRNEEDFAITEFANARDWTHSNAFTFTDDASKVFLNVRNLNRIYKIDVKSKGIDWIMGDGGDFGAGIWDHSHAPQFLSKDRVLIFDNGYRREPPKYSRVIEVQFDPEKLQAEVVWEYRETPDFYSFALGGAEMKPNGNVFITDGTNGRLLEVTRDHKRVWELKLRYEYWTYKAVTVPLSFFTDW